jgi:hypothetical protein
MTTKLALKIPKGSRNLFVAASKAINIKKEERAYYSQQIREEEK